MPALPINEILDSLQGFYGKPSAGAPVDPYEFLVWWHSGYPPSQDRCTKGFHALQQSVGTAPKQLLAATNARIVAALKTGGMVPEVRAAKLKDFAQQIQSDYPGGLHAALSRLPVPQARKVLKTFPGVGNPGADRILLFARLSPVAAVPSACPHVLERVARGPETANYTSSYKQAQQMLSALPAAFAPRIRAYLLIGLHGRELCKRASPACAQCPIQAACAFAKTSKQPR